MAVQELDSYSELRAQFKEICVHFKVYDRQKQYVYLERIWEDRDGLAQLVDISERYLRLLLPDQIPEKTVLLTPDNLASAYGVLPAAFIVGHKLGYLIAVWREMGNLTWGRPSLHGTEEPGLECIVFQDVVNRGTTVLKIAEALAPREWVIKAYVALLLNCRSPNSIDNTKQEYKRLTGSALKFEFLLDAKQICR